MIKVLMFILLLQLSLSREVNKCSLVPWENSSKLYFILEMFPKHLTYSEKITIKRIVLTCCHYITLSHLQTFIILNRSCPGEFNLHSLVHFYVTRNTENQNTHIKLLFFVQCCPIQSIIPDRWATAIPVTISVF